jgi:hypothetical protein
MMLLHMILILLYFQSVYNNNILLMKKKTVCWKLLNIQVISFSKQIYPIHSKWLYNRFH